MTEISERLHRIAQELTTITAQLQAKQTGRPWQPSARRLRALELIKAFVTKEGGTALRVDCVWELVHRKEFGRSTAHEHVRQLARHGLIKINAQDRVSIPGAPSLDALL